MKKIILIIIVSTIAISHSGCSNGISHDEYDALKTINIEAQQDYSSLKADYDELIKSNNQLKKEKEEVENKYSEYFDKYSELLAKSSWSEFIGAWGKIVYGDNIEYSQFGDNTVQLNVTKNNVEDDSIKDFYDKLSDNVSSLATMTSGIDKIYIKLLDSDGIPVMEFFINQSDKDNLIIEVVAGIKYYDDVVSVLNESE